MGRLINYRPKFQKYRKTHFINLLDSCVEKEITLETRYLLYVLHNLEGQVFGSHFFYFFLKAYLEILESKCFQVLSPRF